MQIVAAIGGLSFVLCSLVTGARLLLVARRTRQLPELTLGFGLFLMGGLGYIMTVLGEHGAFLSEAVRAALVGANTLASVIGLSLLAFFTVRVFRPENRLASAAVCLIVGLFCLAFLQRLLGAGFTPMTLGGAPPSTLHAGVTLTVLGWAGIESLLYHGRLRKRMRIGLTDPILVNRIWMWAQGMLMAAFLSAISSAFNLLGIPFNQSEAGMLTVGVLGTLTAGSVWFAFFPPEAYAAWIRSRANPSGVRAGA